jgi:methylenetetrahydrofolate reductase (NADPH)
VAAVPGIDAESPRAALARVLAEPTWEILPLRNGREQAGALPARATASVTASPAKGLEATFDLSVELRRAGLNAVPHLSARMVRDEAQLHELLGQAADAGIDRLFVVGGDEQQPGGYADGLTVLRAITDLGLRPAHVGIPCYPQGHPQIPDEVLLRALHDKAPLADSMTTQLCFDAKAIARWLADRRAEGIDLPVRIGVPGVAEIPKLLSISARIGVRDASRFVLKNRRFVGQLLKSGGVYRPSGLLDDLAPLIADPAAKVIGLHIYTFNNVAPSVAWRDEYAARVARNA